MPRANLMPPANRWPRRMETATATATGAASAEASESVALWGSPKA
jgi:hypothetical protein